jgi:hypothetical protein
VQTDTTADGPLNEFCASLIYSRTDMPLLRSELIRNERSPYMTAELQSKMFSIRMKEIGRLEAALKSAEAIGNQALIEDCASLIWSAGLPLLQEETAASVHTPYLMSARALELIDSMATELRARLHMEVAKCEIRADVLAKAMTHVNKATALDPGSVGATTADPKAPFTSTLIGMTTRLDLRTNLYREATGPMEQCLEAIESAKEAKRLPLREQYLAKAIDRLESITVRMKEDSSGGEEGGGDGSGGERGQSRAEEGSTEDAAGSKEGSTEEEVAEAAAAAKLKAFEKTRDELKVCTPTVCLSQLLSCLLPSTTVCLPSTTVLSAALNYCLFALTH